MHNYPNRLESGGAIDHLPASEASPSATFRRAKLAQCCNATASMSLYNIITVHAILTILTYLNNHIVIVIW